MASKGFIESKEDQDDFQNWVQRLANFFFESLQEGQSTLFITIAHPSIILTRSCLASMQCMQWNDVKSIANSMCPAFRKVRKVTFDKSVKSETKEPFARHKKKHPLTQEEASLQTYLNMVKINPTILQAKVVEKRRKDFGGAWAAPSHFRFMYYIRFYHITRCLWLLELVRLCSISFTGKFLNSPHLAHGACGIGRVYTVVQTIGFFLVFPTASIHQAHQAGIFHGMSWLNPFSCCGCSAKRTWRPRASRSCVMGVALRLVDQKMDVFFMFFMFCSSFLKHSNEFRAG